MAPNFPLTSSLCAHVIFAMTFSYITAMTTTATSANELSLTAEIVPCSHPSALEAARATVLLQQTGARSRLDCLALCSRHSKCTAVAHVQPQDGTSASCILLGSISQNPVTLSTNPSEKCSMYMLNPCPAGTSVFRGYCRCPPGTTGQFCQLTNPDSCSSSWKRLSPENTQERAAIIQANKATSGGYLKVKVNLPEGRSFQLLDGTYFFSPSDKFFASVLTPTLSRKSWEEFDDVAHLELRMMASFSYMHFIEGHNDGNVFNWWKADWFMRIPHVPNPVYTYDDNGQAVNGSVNDVIQAVTKGQVIVTYNAVHATFTEAHVDLSRYHFEIGSEPSNFQFALPSYWRNTKTSTDGKYHTLTSRISNDTVLKTDASSVGSELHADVCWTPANEDHLTAAVLSGQPAHVLVDSLSLAVDQVLVQPQAVWFGTRVFLDPAGPGPFTSTSEEVRLVASTDGQVFKCRNQPQDGSPVFNSTGSANVKWFVNTRQRSRVYSVTSEGEVRAGSEAAVYGAVGQGASVSVGLVFSTPGHFLLLDVHSLELNDSHVLAMVEGLSCLPIPIGLVTSPLECGLRALLVTSQGKVKVYDYVHRQNGTHHLLTNITVDWFVDSYH